MSDWSINIVSEDSLLLEWTLNKHESSTPELNAKITKLCGFLLKSYQAEIINLTPAYRSVLIQFDVLVTNHQQVSTYLVDSLDQEADVAPQLRALHQIPVYYDKSVAADLDQICNKKSISIEKLISLHSSTIYNVYAVGFMPGFAYLGYVPEQLRAARHHSYQGKVPAGSVAIADRQTAIYPTESPGGWQVIGRTPTQLLDNYQSVLQTGDRVQFNSVDRTTFLQLGGLL